MAFAPIYECPNCGDVWRSVSFVDHLYGDNDGDYVCNCGRLVRPKIVERDGARYPVMHAMTEEEIHQEIAYGDVGQAFEDECDREEW